MDETWLHHATPVTKQQSKYGVERGVSATKKANKIAFAGKVMASVFLGSKEIVVID